MLFSQIVAPAISAFPPSVAVKQWRKPRTRIRNLIKLSVSVKAAISIGLSSKGYYRLAKTKAMQMRLTNDGLKTQGLVSLKEQWVKLRYPNG